MSRKQGKESAQAEATSAEHVDESFLRCKAEAEALGLSGKELRDYVLEQRQAERDAKEKQAERDAEERQAERDAKEKQAERDAEERQAERAAKEKQAEREERQRRAERDYEHEENQAKLLREERQAERTHELESMRHFARDCHVKVGNRTAIVKKRNVTHGKRDAAHNTVVRKVQ
ncbi:hypothetical protein ACOMHN_030223 [Nucella lapillus]